MASKEARRKLKEGKRRWLLRKERMETREPFRNRRKQEAKGRWLLRKERMGTREPFRNTQKR